MAVKTNTTIGNSNYYRITKVVGHKINDEGKEVPVRKQFYGKSRKEAEQKCQAYIDAQRSGIKSSRQYFGILADEWIENTFINDGNVKDSTKARYITAWNNYIPGLDFYHLPLEKVTGKVIQDAYNDLAASGCPVSEIRTINKLMRKFYKYVDREELGRNAASSVVVPKEKTNPAADEVSVWSDEELKRILGGFDNADPRFRLRFLIILAIYSGCRKSELLALTYDDITSDGIRINKQLSRASDGTIENRKLEMHLAITDPKTKKSIRTVPVDPVVMKELKMHKKWHEKEQKENHYKTNYIFTTDSGRFYEPKNIDRALYRYYERVGVTPKSIHTYRHTYATNLCKNGVSIQIASRLLGHENIETTARFYVSVDNETMKEAALKVGLSFN